MQVGRVGEDEPSAHVANGLERRVVVAADDHLCTELRLLSEPLIEVSQSCAAPPVVLTIVSQNTRIPRKQVATVHEHVSRGASHQAVLAMRVTDCNDALAASGTRRQSREWERLAAAVLMDEQTLRWHGSGCEAR